VLETTGIAEPASVLGQLDDEAGVQVRAVVCTVDVRAFPDQARRRLEVGEQVMGADRLLLTKLDGASADQLAATHAALDALGTDAERAAFPPGREHPMVTRWVLDGDLTRCAVRHHARHHQQRQLTAAAIELDGVMLEGPLRRLLAHPAILRAKGFARLHGYDSPVLLQLAGGRIEIEPAPVHADAPYTLTIIGEELDDAALRRRVAACRAEP
jgi:G3E family GTPase